MNLVIVIGSSHNYDKPSLNYVSMASLYQWLLVQMCLNLTIFIQNYLKLLSYIVHCRLLILTIIPCSVFYSILIQDDPRTVFLFRHYIHLICIVDCTAIWSHPISSSSYGYHVVSISEYVQIKLELHRTYEKSSLTDR
jgi:hypothetical protein